MYTVAIPANDSSRKALPRLMLRCIKMLATNIIAIMAITARTVRTFFILTGVGSGQSRLFALRLLVQGSGRIAPSPIEARRDGQL